MSRFQAADASFHVPQEYRDIPRTLIRISFKSFKVFKDHNEANDEPLPFGQSYWDYLPDLVQNKIMKMVHKQLLKRVHDELLGNCRCPNCKSHFENPFEMESHWLDDCAETWCGVSDSDSDSDYSYDFIKFVDRDGMLIGSSFIVVDPKVTNWRKPLHLVYPLLWPTSKLSKPS